jgi:hypothetical protein
MSFAAHEEASIVVQAPPEAVFAYLDDPHSLGGHMEKPSAMMLGGSMRYAFDAAGGRAVGSVITMRGDVLGIGLGLEEVITERTSSRKVWETRGEPRLLVIGPYRMGFDVARADGGAMLTVFIDYGLPSRGAALLLGALFGRSYARWCIERMAKDAARHFGKRTNADD